MTADRLKVAVYPFRKGVCHGNIVWPGRFPMRNGQFPKNHPVASPNDKFADQIGAHPTLTAFRDRGYWASCFPEGDGITWKPLKEQSDSQCIADIRECFPQWDVNWHEDARVTP